MTASMNTLNAHRLNNGDPFPSLSAPLVGGGTLALPGDLAGSWSVVLFYRGHWCPFCRSQLTDFQKDQAAYAAEGVRVVALSVDAQEQAERTVQQRALGFPVAYGLDPQVVAQGVGTYLSDGRDGKPTYLQASGFVLDPAGRVVLALYSSGAVGRLNAADTLGLIKYARQH